MTAVLAHSRLSRPFVLAAIVCFLTLPGRLAGQGAAPNSADAQAASGNIRELQAQVSELKQILLQMSEEMAKSRQETKQLRDEVEAMRQRVAPPVPNGQTTGPRGTEAQPQEPPSGQTAAQGQEDRLQRLEEQVGLQAAALSEQNQTKVESASKFHVRLSGAVIFNVINNVGAVDNLDFPELATKYLGYSTSAGGSFGMNLSQSLIGLEVFGPTLGNAHVSGNVQFDFAGGYADTPNGAVLGLPRLRTGVIRIAGTNTDVVAGQDTPFISPLSPTSFVYSANPEFSYAGNLWTWTPQVRVDHWINVSERSKFLLQGGILDPLAGELPPTQVARVAGPGEASQIPAFATRLAWSYSVFDRELTVGAGGYYSRQNWGFGRNADAWAGTTDWLFPLSSRWELSGEFYRGRGIGGLGGGLGRSVVSDGPISDPNTEIQGLDAAGGWAQLKFRQTEKLEWNAGFGEDDSFARDLREYPYVPDGYLYPNAARNLGSFVNFIFRPRSDLVFSVEYRYLHTFMIQGAPETASHIDAGMGILF
jgi:uncharacterized coiled-coil protein SlyX